MQDESSSILHLTDACPHNQTDMVKASSPSTFSAWVRARVLFLMCVRVGVCVYKCVPRQWTGRALLTQPEPLRALNRRCYLVSQVLRLCCSNATGAKTFPCKKLAVCFCGRGTAWSIWLNPPVSFVFARWEFPAALEIVRVDTDTCFLWIFPVFLFQAANMDSFFLPSMCKCV